MKLFRVITTILIFSTFGIYCWVTRNDAYERGYQMATGFKSEEARQQYIQQVIEHHIDSIIRVRLR